MMAKDSSKLVGRIIEKYNTRKIFAKEIGMDPAALSRRLKFESEWSLEEALQASEKLEIPLEEVGIYFFGQNYK